MNINLKNARLMLNGNLVTLPELYITADEADLVTVVTECQYGMPLDQARLLGVFVSGSTATVEDRTPDNKGAGAYFSMRHNVAEMDDPGLRVELNLSDEAEEDWGNAQFGELWFGAGPGLPGIVYQPDKASIDESGY